ncbi:MAG: glycosyl hydrolase [Thermoguttaceae bacterium]
MKQQKWELTCLLVLLVCALSLCLSGFLPAQMSTLNSIEEPGFETFKETFQKMPGCDYSTGPLWTWNDRLTEEQVRSTLRDLAGQNVKQVWVHPRPGLMTPYLSEEWFDRWKESLDEAKKLDMNVWIYDENSYPSGFAGGFVPESMPDSRGKGLHLRAVESMRKIRDNVEYIFKVGEDGQITEVTQEAKKAGKLGEGKWIVGTIEEATSGPWFGDQYYVDLLKPGVTEKFIEITFDAYKREVGDDFGGRVPGIFTDEPHLQTAGGLTWNDEIPVLFEKKYGYSLVDSLPSLVQPIGNWKKVRHDYQRLLLDLFVDRWAKPCFKWCEENKLEFTGHYWEHGWPVAGHGPDNMAMYIWHQRPAIDVLMNQYAENVNSQFGNVRIVKEMSSVVNQTGRARTLCELYGAGGWDLRFEDMKRQADWGLVLGINTINEHISYVTLRGARKRDHPQSFSYHTGWWKGYHTLANRNTRLQYALSQGRQVNRILVLEPTTTAWMYQGDDFLGEIGNSFQHLVNEMEKMNIEYDLGSEDIIERLGHVNNGKLVVGEAMYDMIVLPPNTENLDSRTLDFIANVAKGGGTVLYFDLPKFVNGAEPQGVAIQQLKLLEDCPSSKKVDLTKLLIAGWNRTAGEGLRVAPDGLANVFVQANGILKEERALGRADYVPPQNTGQVYHHRRRLGDKDVVFLTNISMEEPASGWVYSNKDHVDRWNEDTGEITPYPCEEVGRPYIKYRYELPPCGSLLLVLSGTTRVSQRDNPVAPVVPKEWYFPFSSTTETVIEPGSGPNITRLEPNVLTIDYMDVQVGDEILKNVYFHKANHWVFEKNGKSVGLTRNPWDNGVQFKDTLIKKEFPAESGFSATYRFTIAEKVPQPLYIVVERSDLYTISCNGTVVSAKTDEWWLDKSFYKIDLSETAKVGENEVVLVAKPMSIYHELEPAYLLGDFSLESAEEGFVVKPPQPVQLRVEGTEEQGWNQQGMPFYSGAVSYCETFDVENPVSGDYFVKLPASPNGWYGATAKVVVNGKEAGYVLSSPWKVNITPYVQPGKNTVDVQVIGTPKNLLGPHHIGRARGSAWPNAFWQSPKTRGPGSAYDTIGYGLFQPFVLVKESK